MWCKQCNIETNEKICPVCGTETVEDLPIEVFWCTKCEIPIIHQATAADKGVCPICNNQTKYLATDLRPVFPEERLLLAFLFDKSPNYYMNSSVWAANSRYYINGKSLSVSTSTFAKANTDSIAERVSASAEFIEYNYFDNNIAQFIVANQHRLAYLKDEAFSFVRNAAKRVPEENIVISFSGGKDSTVTADVVTKALSNSSLVHIFGNTTLEFPYTIEYANRYRDNHPLAIFQVAKNDEQIFYDVCEDIGPPARMMRWCCSMFKTGPITRVINSLYRSQQILTFYGIRKSESVSRSKYNRIEDDAKRCEGRVLFVAHTMELVNQAYKTFRDLWPEVPVGKFADNLKEPDAHVVCGSIQSVALNIDRFHEDDFDYLRLNTEHGTEHRGRRR